MNLGRMHPVVHFGVYVEKYGIEAKSSFPYRQEIFNRDSIWGETRDWSVISNNTENNRERNSNRHSRFV